MTLNSQNKTDKNTVELVITVPADEFDAAVERSYRKNITKMNVPGFRKGKAPRRMVEKMYGAEVFYDDAINEIYPDAYEAAVAEAKIEPVDRASVEIVSVDENGFKFKATVTVKRQGRLIDAEEDAVTKKGDTVTFDFDGYVDGKQFDGGKAEDYDLVLGSGQFIPGFEDQMIGKKAGEQFSVNVKFPEDYHAEELRGKDAEFKINLKAIRTEELPELDDEFAKDVSDFDTLKEFKDDIKKKIKERKEQEAEYKVEKAISDKLADLVKADIPQCMFDTEINRQLQDFEQRFASQGLSLEQYMKYTGATLDSLKNMFRETAERDVKTRLALEKIAELEGIVITDAEVDEEYNKYASEMAVEVEKLKNDYVTEQIMKDLTVRKAFEAVKNNAEITEKAAAKKTAAKKTSEKAEEKPAAEKKPAAKKPAAKKTAEKKTEPAEKKPAAKKTSTAAKKPAAKKTAEKKAE